MKIVYLLAVLALAGCDSGKSKAASHWYDSWIADKLAQGAVFHSEFELPSGQTQSITFDAAGRSQIGFVVKEGYDVTKSGGAIYMGTADHPRDVGGSPGVSAEFAPTDGKIVIQFENASPITTRVATYIKK